MGHYDIDYEETDKAYAVSMDDRKRERIAKLVNKLKREELNMAVLLLENVSSISKVGNAFAAATKKGIKL